MFPIDVDLPALTMVQAWTCARNESAHQWLRDQVESVR
jgi:hypothetical protein